MSLPGDISVQTLHIVCFLNTRDAVKFLHSLARMVAEHQCFSQFYISEKSVKIFNNSIKKIRYSTLILSISNIMQPFICTDV